MQIMDALNLGHELLKPYIEKQELSSDWKIRFDSARRRFGQCRHRDKVISLSRHLVLLNEEAEVRDTILHEIAHALTPGSGHGWKWKLKAKEIGARPERCYSSSKVVTVKAPWLATCNNCSRQVERFKISNSLACGACCRRYNDGRHSAQYLFSWSKNI